MMVPVLLIAFGSLFIYSAIKGEKNPLNVIRTALADAGIVDKGSDKSDDWQGP